MALKLNLPFPIFSPSAPSSHPRGLSEVRFSRWNNANAERFNQRRREQEEIESDLRRVRRYDSAEQISLTHDASGAREAERTARSFGTPSAPSAPSIPGRKSKYSKPFKPPKTKNKPQVPERLPQVNSKPEVRVSEDGVSYFIDGAPFEFKYSYTEAPKVKPLRLREAYAPFGPATLGRPWTGSPPLPPSKKKLKEFDSFELPPPGKKGVKPVQKPGPFLPGSGPRYVKTREEIQGEALTKEEVKELINGCIRSRRLLHMGRDGFTHNMLDNIHAHWKRRRVCKIKCLGVCTVDMDNVCQQLEEKTGGQVIHRTGGVVFLFRGRNYNYRNRPQYPLMLWRPVAPIYPRLVKRVPDGLTLKEAAEMRKKGQELMPICRLAKNGVYSDLVKEVREAFEVCELVKISCQGVKGSDYRKIGAKLRDLVPCVLLSFANESILIWRGRNWKSCVSQADNGDESINKNEDEASLSSMDSVDLHSQLREDPVEDFDSSHVDANNMTLMCEYSHESKTSGEADSDSANSVLEDNTFLEESGEHIIACTEEGSDMPLHVSNLRTEPGGRAELPEPESGARCMEGLQLLMNQAVETGMALVLDEVDLDPDIVSKRAAAFASSAPTGPAFGENRERQIEQKKKQQIKASKLGVREETIEDPERSEKQRAMRTKKPKRNELNSDFRGIVPQGSMGIDELAKLLS